MRKTTCKEKCPFCDSSKSTIYKSKPQCYCKACHKYFNPGTSRNKYSDNAVLVLKTIINLMYPQNIKPVEDFNHFAKKVLSTKQPIYNDVRIKYKTIPEPSSDVETNEISIPGNLTNSIILTKSGNDFIITRSLNVCQKIKFNDFNINTNVSGRIKQEYS